MSKKKRNHIIPKVLLNRFASRKEGKKAWIWQVSKTDDPREISTRNAAVSSYFYGKPETGIEEMLGPVEGMIGSTLTAIDKGDDLETLHEEFRHLCWNLAVRTRALREQYSSMGNTVIESINNGIESDEAGQSLCSYFDENANEIIQRHADSYPRNERRAFLSKMKKKSNRIQFVSMMKSATNDSSIIKTFSNMVTDKIKSERVFEKASKDGQLRALSDSLKYGSSPEWFIPIQWHIIERQDPYFILGDSCLITQREDGSVGSLFKFSSEWKKLYLPISPHKVLVGSRSDECHILSDEQINQAQAEISQSHIFSSHIDEGIIRLSDYIREGEPIVSNEEFERFLSNPWNKS